MLKNPRLPAEASQSSTCEVPSECNPESLCMKMNHIRNGSERHIAGFRRDAERAADIREYVKSQPMLTAGVAACLGYSVVSSLVDSPKKSRHEDSSGQDAAEAKKTTLVSGAAALVGAAATAAIRKWATDYVRTQFVGRADAR